MQRGRPGRGDGTVVVADRMETGANVPLYVRRVWFDLLVCPWSSKTCLLSEREIYAAFHGGSSGVQEQSVINTARPTDEM